MDVCLCLKGVCGPTEVERLWVLKKVFFLPKYVVAKHSGEKVTLTTKNYLEEKKILNSLKSDFEWKLTKKQEIK